MNRSPIEWCDRELGFLEGLIDSDGSISLSKEKRPHFKAGVTYKPNIRIGNICIELLEKAHSIIGFGSINEHKTHKGNHPFFQLTVHSNGIRRILPHLQLIVKEKQRLLVLEACDILNKRISKGNPRTDHEISRLEEIYIEIKKRNGKVWNK